MFTKRSYRRNKPKQNTWLESSEQKKESSFIPPLQTKLNIGEPGDVYEQEADKTADAVVNKSSSQADVQKKGEEKEEVQAKGLANNITPFIQKMEEEEPVQKKEEEEPVQKKEEEEPVQKKEEEEPVQKKEEEEPVQKKEEEEPVQKKEEEESVQKMEKEEPVQKMEEEEPVQKMEKEEPVQKMEEEEPVQKMEEEEPVQKKEEEEPIQKKEATKSSSKPSLESSLKNKKGGGSKMDYNTKSEMEAGFGADFSGIRIHTDSKSQEMSQNIGAQAFTHGNDVYFNQGKYNPRSREGKHLLAHELTHTIQQGKSKGSVNQKVQRKGKEFRYTPPKSVKRSIEQIQMIVGATADGIYGPKTRADVIRYQQRMKKLKRYKDTVDGKWGKNTEAAHQFMAQPRSLQAKEGYNCSGFVLKEWRPIFLPETKKIYSGFKKLKNANAKCNPFEYKIWLWVMNVKVVNSRNGLEMDIGEDFHTVGGRTHKDGSGPLKIMSKNGPRPLEGPGTPMSFEPKSGPAIGADGKKHPFFKWKLSKKKLTTYCTKKIP